MRAASLTWRTPTVTPPDPARESMTTLQRIQLIRPWVSESSQRELDRIAADVRALQTALDARLFDTPRPVSPMERAP